MQMLKSIVVIVMSMLITSEAAPTSQAAVQGSPSGVKKWSHKAGGPVGGSPAIGADGAVYVGSDDNHMYAFSSNGDQQWSFLAGDSIFSSTTIGKDGTIFFGAADHMIYAVHPNGTQRFSFETGATVYGCILPFNLNLTLPWTPTLFRNQKLTRRCASGRIRWHHIWGLPGQQPLCAAPRRNQKVGIHGR